MGFWKSVGDALREEGEKYYKPVVLKSLAETRKEVNSLGYEVTDEQVYEIYMKHRKVNLKNFKG